MFTGIVEEVGTIRQLTRAGQENRLVIGAALVLQGTKLGDSIAVNGVCLTASHLTPTSFVADVMPETFRRTNLGELKPGAGVNLERALAYGGRIGGHFVTGHIDGRGTLSACRTEENAVVMIFAVEQGLREQIITKGSVAIDGISLTVGGLTEDGFWVSLIPHTVQNTVLRYRQVGDVVNIETDMLGKYVQSAVRGMLSNDSAPTGLTWERLRSWGY